MAQNLSRVGWIGADGERAQDIRKIIERNIAEIEAFGVCATVAQTSGPLGGRPATEYWLTEEQALLVSVLSKAPKAPAVRAMLIKVFITWWRGNLGVSTISPEVVEKIPLWLGVQSPRSLRLCGQSPCRVNQSDASATAQPSAATQIGRMTKAKS